MGSSAEKADDYPQPIKGESYQHFEARVKEHELKREHAHLVKSGMFWEFFPELTGTWEKDKKAFVAYRAKHSVSNATPTPKEWEKTPPCSVSERIKQRIDASTQKGIEKYGATLDRTDLGLREWLEHAVQECLDAAKYFQKAIDELDAGNRA